MRFLPTFLSLITLLFPSMLVAQTPQNFRQVSDLFVDLLTSLIPILVGGAMLVFFWGLIKYLTKINDANAHKQGKDLMLWGIVTIFVMLSLWGIVRFMQRSIGISY